MDKLRKTSLTTQYIILFAVLFLLANIVLGFVLHHYTSAMMQRLIQKNMLTISNTAAELLDGDAIGSLTEEEIGSPAYNEIYRTLSVFQNNADIEYIYAVRQVGKDKYAFTVDPDPEDPGAFGEEVVVTKALRKAGRGIPSVDDETAADRWGNFYSSYSPIFDSKGKVAGIIGVDFSSSWYDEQVWKNTIHVNLISIMFTLVGALGFFLISIRVRKRFDELDEDLSTLSEDIEELSQELLSDTGRAGYDAEDEVAETGTPNGEEDFREDEIRALSHKIRIMHREMERYLDYLHAQANTDALTGIGNTTAYQDRQSEMEEKILDGSADFSLIIFDIDNLKLINDHYGHAGGDQIIRTAADVIADAFGRQNTYRIGGDEFIAVAEHASEEELSDRMKKMEELLDAFDRSRMEEEAQLHISVGRADYVPGEELTFHDVFVRADGQMYEMKELHHK